jgi:hypothetical protein
MSQKDKTHKALLETDMYIDVDRSQTAAVEEVAGHGHMMKWGVLAIPARSGDLAKTAHSGIAVLGRLDPSMNQSINQYVFISVKSNPSLVGSEQTAPLVNYLPRSSNG